MTSNNDQVIFNLVSFIFLMIFILFLFDYSYRKNQLNQIKKTLYYDSVLMKQQDDLRKMDSIIISVKSATDTIYKNK